MSKRAKIILRSGKDQSLRRYHPWVFSGAIKKIEGTPAEGDIVSVYTNKDEFLGTGHYQDGAIAVRVFSFDDRDIDSGFWKQKLLDAYQLRKDLGLAESNHTNVFRWVNAEGDGMPGLILDYYNGTVVFQAHSIGMYMIRDTITGALHEILGEQLNAVYDKSLSTLPKNIEIDKKEGYLFQNGRHLKGHVMEYGNVFKINWEDGQKTGFYIDQRENRQLLMKYAKNKKILNVFCYTGGFSVYALKGEAQIVHSVDSSNFAMDMVDDHVTLNNKADNHQSFTADAFEFLKETSEEYDIIIVDPPAFAKHKNVLQNALKGYKRLNALAFEKVKKGGLVFTFSCSQVVSKNDFKKMMFQAAANANKQVQILYQLSQPQDHPVSIYHPEGEYLKGLVLRVS